MRRLEGVVVLNDSMRHELNEAMAVAQEQMREISVIQQQRSMLTATGTAADGLVEVTVDAHGLVTSTVIGEAYLEEYEMAELGGHVTAAAQSAVQDLQRRSAALFAPIERRRQEIAELSGRVVDGPVLGQLLSQLGSGGLAGDSAQQQHNNDDDDRPFPTVRR